jgi:four helix bundle protein
VNGAQRHARERPDTEEFAFYMCEASDRELGAGMILPMPPARSFKDLIVWQKAHAFVLEVYILTALFPKQEMYGLTSQMRRAAVSIAANIAEGFRKRGKADKARFLNTAEGSVGERQYYLILARDLQYAETDSLVKLLDEIGRLLNSYSRAILASNF